MNGRTVSTSACDTPESTLSVKGPKGELGVKVASGITFELADGNCTVTRSGDSPKQRANHGLMRALLANMVTGVTAGFEKKLEITGLRDPSGNQQEHYVLCTVQVVLG